MSGCSRPCLLPKTQGMARITWLQGQGPQQPGSSREAGRAGLRMAANFSLESRASDNFVVMRQVPPQARKWIHRSGSGLVRLIMVRHSPVITRQVPSDDPGLRSSWEISGSRSTRSLDRRRNLCVWAGDRHSALLIWWLKTQGWASVRLLTMGRGWRLQVRLIRAIKLISALRYLIDRYYFWLCHWLPGDLEQIPSPMLLHLLTWV